LKEKRLNALHMIHKWSIEHPYAVIAFYVAMIALAWISISRMPRRFAPYVESPMVGVVTMMPGLSAQEMETYISKPIEEQLINVKGVRYVRSTSQDGFSIVTLEFPYGSNMQRAQTDIQSLMNVVQSNLPATGANLKPSFIVPIDPLNLPVLTLSLRGDAAKGWDMAKVREFADNTVVRRFKAVQDVYAVVPFGGYRRQLQVIVDRDKLSGYGLSILDVRDAIDRSNVSASGGTLTSGDQEGIVRVETKAASAADLLNYPVVTAGVPAVGPSSAGSPMGMGGTGQTQANTSIPNTPNTSPPNTFPRVIYIRDVARVIDTYWEQRSGYHYLDNSTGPPSEPGMGEYDTPAVRGPGASISVSVIQNPGASSAQVVPAVMKVVGQLEAENPGLKFDVAYDNAHFVDILFDNVWHELAIAVLLTGIALVLFLGEWRSTLIAMVTLPTSLAMAVLFMVPFGMTFNSGTLIGLLLSIGRLVDDSVIDIHAVSRHLKLG
jgi:hydrophobic/amphiphilic exporter-1 (mainly G- bacteria), HAE1 family